MSWSTNVQTNTGLERLPAALELLHGHSCWFEITECSGTESELCSARRLQQQPETDGPGTRGRELALGQFVRVIYTSREGYNYGEKYTGILLVLWILKILT